MCECFFIARLHFVYIGVFIFYLIKKVTEIRLDIAIQYSMPVVLMYESN